MHTPPEEKNHRQPAPCLGARRLLMVAASTSMLLVFATAADQVLQVTHEGGSAGAWMKAMNLSAPALWAAGSPMRHPETVHPGVDLRLCTGLADTP